MTHASPTTTGAPAPSSSPSRPLEPMVAELLAEALSQGPHLLRGKFFEFAAEATADGHLLVDLRQVDFLAERDPVLNGVVLEVSIPSAETAERGGDKREASAT